MASAKELLKKFRKINNLKTIQKEVETIIINDQLIIEAKQDEFEQGLAPDGNDIGDYSWNEYKEYKESINPRANGKVDLKLTGSFHQGLFVESLGSSRFMFNSRDSKSDKLFGRSYKNGVNGQILRSISEETFLDLQKKKYRGELVRVLKRKAGLR